MVELYSIGSGAVTSIIFVRDSIITGLTAIYNITVQLFRFSISTLENIYTICASILAGLFISIQSMVNIVAGFIQTIRDLWRSIGQMVNWIPGASDTFGQIDGFFVRIAQFVNSFNELFNILARYSNISLYMTCLYCISLLMLTPFAKYALEILPKLSVIAFALIILFPLLVFIYNYFILRSDLTVSLNTTVVYFTSDLPDLFIDWLTTIFGMLAKFISLVFDWIIIFIITFFINYLDCTMYFFCVSIPFIMPAQVQFIRDILPEYAFISIAILLVALFATPIIVYLRNLLLLGQDMQQSLQNTRNTIYSWLVLAFNIIAGALGIGRS